MKFLLARFSDEPQGITRHRFNISALLSSVWTTLLCNVGRITVEATSSGACGRGGLIPQRQTGWFRVWRNPGWYKGWGGWVWEMEYPSWMWPFGTSAFVYHFLLFGKESVTWNPGSLNKWRKATSLLCGPHWKEGKISGLWGWGSREGKARMEWKTSKG